MHDVRLKNRIRVFRAEHRLSQSDLAERIGVSRKTISTIETGRFVPSTIISMLIAREFDVSVEDLFSLEGEDTSPKFEIWKQDAHGRESLVAGGLSRREADRRIKFMEAKGDKSFYSVETDEG